MSTTTAFDNAVIVGIENALPKKKYTCRDCNSILVPVLNGTRAKHFRHQSTETCSGYRKMSDWHIEWQLKFLPKYREVSIRDENNKVINRADIRTENNVIEIQHSHISEDKIQQREKTYGESLIWILDGTTPENDMVIERFRTKISSYNVFIDDGKELNFYTPEGNIVYLSYTEFFFEFGLFSSLVNPCYEKMDILYEKIISKEQEHRIDRLLRLNNEHKNKIEHLENKIQEILYRKCIECKKYNIEKGDEPWKVRCLDCYFVRKRLL